MIPRRDRLLLLLPVFVGMVLSLEFWPYVIDDAYICLRYAQNLVDGQGLVFNPGERVEGYSDPPWVLLLAIGLALGFRGLVFAKVVGLLALPATVLAGYGLACRWAEPTRRAAHLAIVLALTLLATSLPVVYHTQTGLETAAYVAVLVAALYRLEAERTGDGLFQLSALLAAVAALFRPEAPLLVLGLVLGRVLAFLDRREKPQLARRRLLVWLGLFGAPCAAWVAFRFAFYGSWIANTYYVKGSSGPWILLWGYLRPYLHLELALVLIGLAGLGVLLVKRRSLSWRTHFVRLAPLLWVIGAQAFFLAWVTRDWMPNQRYLTPILPPLMIAAAAGLGILAETLPGIARLAPAVVVVFGLGVQAWRSFPVRDVSLDRTTGAVRTLPKVWHLPFFRRIPWAGVLNPYALWAIENVPAGSTVVTSEIGIASYAGSWRIIDFRGLTDATLSGATGATWPARIAYIHQQRPEWLLIASADSPSARLLKASRWLFDEYELGLGPTGYWMARRKDTPLASDEQALANLAHAVAQEPRFPHFLWEQIRWTAWVRGREAAEPLIATYVARFHPSEKLRQRLLGLLDSAAASPRVALEPLDLEPPSENPFRAPGGAGLGLGWTPSKAAPPGDRAFLEEETLVLTGGEQSAPIAACGPFVAVGTPKVRVVGEVQVESAFTDAPAKLAFDLLGQGLHAQPLLEIGPTDAWSPVNESVDTPSGAEKFRICATFRGAGKARLKDVIVWAGQAAPREDDAVEAP
jgi:arabinofuranosyltransferase